MCKSCKSNAKVRMKIENVEETLKIFLKRNK